MDAELFVLEYYKYAHIAERVVVTGRRAVGEYAIKKLKKLCDASGMNLREFLENKPITHRNIPSEVPAKEGFYLYSKMAFPVHWIKVNPVFYNEEN